MSDESRVLRRFPPLAKLLPSSRGASPERAQGIACLGSHAPLLAPQLPSSSPSSLLFPQIQSNPACGPGTSRMGIHKFADTLMLWNWGSFTTLASDTTSCAALHGVLSVVPGTP